MVEVGKMVIYLAADTGSTLLLLEPFFFQACLKFVWGGISGL